MNKLIEKMKQDKLKVVTIIAAVIVFIVGIVVNAVNVDDTYADSISDYSCPLGGNIFRTTTSSNGYACQFFAIPVSVGDYIAGTPITSNADCRNYLDAAGYTYNSSSGSTDCVYDAIKKNVSTSQTVEASFNSNGGYVSPTSKTCSYDLELGQLECSVTLPTPSRTGYTFNGWCRGSSSCSNPIKNSATIATDTTFYASWSSNDITVEASFNSNGGYVSPTSKTCSYNPELGELECSVTLPTPSRTGYTFNGWCKGSFSCSNPIKNSATIATDTTFYASWSSKDITVEASFNSNGGSVSPTSKTCSYNTELGELECSITLPTVTRENHTFNGWCRGSSSCSNPIKNSATIATDTIFYANWTMVDNNPSNPGGGDEDNDDIVEGGTTNDSNNSSNSGNSNNDADVVPGGPMTDSNKPSTPDNSNPDDDVVPGGTMTDSNKPSTPDNSSDSDNPKTDDELDENEKTGDILIIMVWVIGLGALGYSVYYFMKQRNTI